ncbi:hypothetical protein LXL04_019290 [Taraxacum kok-saghyz]
MLIAAAHAHRRCSSIAVFSPDRRPSSVSLISGAPLLHTNLRFQPSRPPVSAYRPPISADFCRFHFDFSRFQPTNPRSLLYKNRLLVEDPTLAMDVTP